MVKHHMIPPLVIALALLTAAPPAFAQGKGNEKAKQSESRGKQGKGQGAQKQENRGNAGKAQGTRGNDNRGNAGERGSERANEVGRGNDRPVASDDRGVARGNRGRYTRAIHVRDVHPNLRRFASSSRAPERIAAGALSRGLARGLADDDIVIRQNGNRVSMLNDDGIVLIDMDEERARNLGGWRVDPWDDDVKAGAPSFCRSGEGHPVFGREWCLDKGFGLGDYRNLRWGRSTDVGDIIFQRQVDRGTLARAVLIDVLGDVVFNRLGLHAITLGYNDPLTGVWLGEPTGPQMLRINSGDMPIAEIYDDNRDQRADALVVSLRAW